jgi:hypothetical protein
MNKRTALVILNTLNKYYKNMNRLRTPMRTRGNALLLATPELTSHRISPRRRFVGRVRRVKTKILS